MFFVVLAYGLFRSARFSMFPLSLVCVVCFGYALGLFRVDLFKAGLRGCLGLVYGLYIELV